MGKQNELLNANFSERLCRLLVETYEALMSTGGLSLNNYGICVSGPYKSQFMQLIIYGLNTQNANTLLQKLSEYQEWEIELKHILSNLCKLNINVINIDKLQDNETLIEQVCRKVVIDNIELCNLDISQRLQIVNDEVEKDPSKRIILYLDDIITEKSDIHLIYEYHTLTSNMSNQIKVISSYEPDVSSVVPSMLEKIYNHSSDFVRVYISDLDIK